MVWPCQMWCHDSMGKGDKGLDSCFLPQKCTFMSVTVPNDPELLGVFLLFSVVSPTEYFSLVKWFEISATATMKVFGSGNGQYV